MDFPFKKKLKKIVLNKQYLNLTLGGAAALVVMTSPQSCDFGAHSALVAWHVPIFFNLLSGYIEARCREYILMGIKCLLLLELRGGGPIGQTLTDITVMTSPLV